MQLLFSILVLKFFMKAYRAVQYIDFGHKNLSVYLIYQPLAHQYNNSAIKYVQFVNKLYQVNSCWLKIMHASNHSLLGI